MLANCNAGSYRINKGRMVRISNYSRDALPELLAEVPLEFDQREAGTLQLFRTEKQLKASKADQEVLAEYDSPFAVLDRDECIAVEPGLRHVADKFVGGLRLLADRTGDCRMFTLALAARTEALGATFQYGVTIRSIEREGARIVGVETDHGRETADVYVCALGPYAPILLKPLGIRLPIYPIKGYSITLPVTDPDSAPASTVMDETHKVAITRLGDRIRVAGQAEIIGYNARLGKSATDTVRYVVSDLFPKGGDVSRAEGWTGLRPMTPDGTPVLGPTRYREPVPQHRARHARLDHVRGFGPGGGGPRAGADAGDLLRRAHCGALRAVGLRLLERGDPCASAIATCAEPALRGTTRLGAKPSIWAFMARWKAGRAAQRCL